MPAVTPPEDRVTTHDGCEVSVEVDIAEPEAADPPLLTFTDEVARLALFLAGLMLAAIGVCSGLAVGSPALDTVAAQVTYVVGLLADVAFLGAAFSWVRHGADRWLRGATAVTAVAVAGVALGVFEWIGRGHPAASPELLAVTITAGAVAAAIAAVSAAPTRSVRFAIVLAAGFAALCVTGMLAPELGELAGTVCRSLT